METPTSPPEPDLSALDRYLAGESTSDEHAAVSAWLAHGDTNSDAHSDASRNPHNDARNAMPANVRALQQVVQHPWPDGAMRSIDEQERTFWKTVKREFIDRASSRPRSAPSFRNARIAKQQGWQRAVRPSAIGATLLALLTIGFWLLDRRPTTTPAVTYQTAPREQRTILFADGSRAILAPSTTVTYTDARHVSVNGQAAFTVASKSNHPFIVHTRNAVVQVLGTTFSIRAYPDTSAVRVVVASGRVAVSRVQERHTPRRTPSRQPVVIEAGSAVDVRPDTFNLESNIDVAAAMTWTTGRLVFDQTPVATVFEELHRWYGIDATFADPSLGNRRLSFTLYRDTDIETTINLVAAVLDARAERVGTRIVFHRR